MLDRQSIINAQDLPIEKVPVPEWGGSVLLRGLNSGQRDRYIDEHVKIESKGGRPEVSIASSEALLVSMCIVDKDGNRIFSDTDAPALAAKSGKVLHRLAAIIEQMSGLGKKADDVGNFPKTDGDDSGSD